MTRYVPAADPAIKDLFTALGLDWSKSRRLTIDIAVDSILVTYVEQYITADEVASVTEVVKHFKLVPK